MQHAAENSDAGASQPSDCSGKFSCPESGEKNIRAHLARIGPNRAARLRPCAPIGNVQRDGRQMSRVGIEGRASESANGAGRFGGRAHAAQRRVIEVGPENPNGGLQGLRTERCLPPAHHLRVEPGGLHRIRPLRAFPPDQQIAVALALVPSGEIFSRANQRALDHLGIDADPVRLGQQIARPRRDCRAAR